MRRVWLIGLLAASLLAAPAIAAPKDKGDKGDKKSDEGPRKDPKGVKGISPFWEAIAKGDKAYIARDLDGAIAAYREALQHEPQNAIGSYRLGEALLAKGDPKEAEASWHNSNRFATTPSVRAKALFVLADLPERYSFYDEADKRWEAYETHAQAEPEAKTFPKSAADRRKKIADRKRAIEDYGAVKDRIEKRLSEVEKKGIKP